MTETRSSKVSGRPRSAHCRRPGLLAVVASVLSLLLVVGCGTSAGESTNPPRLLATPPASATFAPTGPTMEARVVRVVDGDTIIVEVAGRQQRLRYIGIDAPESVKQDTPVEPFALEASAANEALVGGRTVVLELDVSETDRFGRLLRDVWVTRDGELILVNLELVRLGLATVTTFPPDVKYVDQLLAAQADARDRGVGLWSLAPPP